MTLYLACYYVHVVTVTLSGSFFLVRGLWMMTDNALLEHRVVRISPHIIDSILLTAAIALAVMSSQYPFYLDWLTAKFFALIAYIVLGMFALRRGKTRRARFVFLLMALLTFGYMVSVALTRSALGPLSWL